MKRRLLRKEDREDIAGGPIVSKIRAMIARDMPYIVVIILCLGACIYTLGQVNGVMETCNKDWQGYTKDFCRCSDLNLSEGRLDYGIKGMYQDTQGQG